MAPAAPACAAPRPGAACRSTCVTVAQVGTGYDTVVAVLTLSALADLDRELDALRQLLAPDGRLLFLDHSPRRPAGVATELSRPLWRLMVDGFCARPRPAERAVRQSGLIILSIERFGLTTLTLPLRSCVAGGGTAATTRRRPQGGGRPVTGTLALIGGGDFDATDAVDRQLLARSGGDSVLVLPTADAFEHPERSVTRAESWFAARSGSARGLAVLARPDASRRSTSPRFGRACSRTWSVTRRCTSARC